ncbi:MAG: hypothetical protein ACLSCV_10305 [Acutalibacteraceae bacterium]
MDITGVLENGYHQLEMIMQSVSLHDKVTITDMGSSQNISVSCSLPSLCLWNKILLIKLDLFFSIVISNLLFPFILKNTFLSQAGLAGGR